MRLSIVSVGSLLLFAALLANSIETSRFPGAEAKLLVKRADAEEGGSSKAETKGTKTEESSEKTSKSASDADDEPETSQSEEEPTPKTTAKPQTPDSAEAGSRSASAADSEGASEPPSAATSTATPNSARDRGDAEAEVSSEADVTSAPPAGSAALTTSEPAESRSGFDQDSSTAKPADAEETTDKSDAKPAVGGDEDSDSPAEENSGDSKGDEQHEGGSRMALPPNFSARASAGFDLNLFNGLGTKNRTMVLSMKADLNGGASNKEGSKSTLAPTLILDRNGTKAISAGGTTKPVEDAKAKELMERAKNDPKSFKLETFESFREYDEIVKESNRSSVQTRELLINGQPTTTTKPAPSSTSKAPAASTNSTTSTSSRPSPLLSTTKKVGSTSAKPSGSISAKPVVSSSAKPTPPQPQNSSKRPIAASSTVPPTKSPAATTSPLAPLKCPTCPTCARLPASNEKQSCGDPKILSDFQASDKLLAVAVTNKGYFKGRRINAKAIETIMNGRLNSAGGQSIDKGITISSNNSFVFPAGHYYFPQPVRFAGFRSP